MVTQSKHYDVAYSLGIYVDGWWGGNDAPPHIFIGLKNEKIKFSSSQITMFKQMFQGYKNYENFIKNAESFVQPKTQYQLTQALSKKDIKKSENRQAWLNGENDKEHVEKRAEFDRDFTFFRICQVDITLKFKEFLKALKAQPNTYDEIVKYIDIYTQTYKEHLLNIEGFFGFGPYVSSARKMADEKFKNQAKNESGGKVYQSNQYDHKFDSKDYEKPSKLANPPQNDKDRKYFAFSEGHILGNIRPLDTFFTDKTVVFDIHQDLFLEVAKKVLLDTIVSDDSFRTKECFFDERNTFKDYRVIKNSCVDFVQDKMEVAQIITDNKTSLTPNKLLHRLKKISVKQDSKMKAEILFYDITLFYQNYATLCSIDSSWECENGLKAFGKYCNGILHSALLDDTKANRLGKNKIDLLSRNADIEHIADDISMRLNTHFCVYCYFQDAIDYDVKKSKISLLILDENKRFLKADVDNDFTFSDFNFADMNDKTIQALSLSMYHQQPIIFHNISNHNICKLREHHGMYIQTFVEHFAGLDKSVGDYRHSLQVKEVRYA